MSFWSTSDGESAKTTGAEFDAGGGNMEPIPEGTTVLAMPDDAKWANDRNDNEYLSIRWTVLKPETYLNRKIFQKLWVSDEKPNQKDPAKYKDKQLKMLAAIDTNAGGKLLKIEGKPNDDQLALALTNKQMTLRLGVWAMEGDNRPMTGNWIQAISDKAKPVSEPAPKSSGNGGSYAARGRGGFADDLDDDVPFMTRDSMF